MRYTTDAYPEYVAEMFEELGHEYVDHVKDAEFLVFSGGHDVNPAVYGHEKHKTTSYSLEYDEKSISLFNGGYHLPKVGICRGSQFLCVMNGGTLYQNVSTHCGDHLIYGVMSESGVMENCNASSTHHQMMKPPSNAQILAVAHERSVVEWWGGNYWSMNVLEETPEAVYFPISNSLGFQPHPEFDGYTGLTKAFKFYLDSLLQGREYVSYQKKSCT